MTYRNLKDHTRSNCRVRIYDNGESDFISYYTVVLMIRYIDGQRHIHCTGTYSPTTRKQIGYFLKEYAPNLCYQDMKRIAETGEFMPF